MAYRWRSTDRASLAARSRRLRDAVKDGWDTDRIAAAREQLVDMAILMGTDYNEGVKGVGPIKALKLIRQFGSLEAALRFLRVRPDPDIDLEAIRRFFLDPPATDDYELVWKPPDEGRLIEFLCEERDFSKKRVLTAIDRLRSSFGSTERARSLEDYWSD